MSSVATVTAFAPATVANVSVGFDVLGFAFGSVGDRVTVTRTSTVGEVAVDGIEGVVTELPRDPRRNTASVALLAMIEDVRPRCGFRVRLYKGIPLGSGMGGSAASAVAAVVAGAALLDEPPGADRLLGHALAGEEAASGAPHADNAAPCLYGGLVATVASHPPEVVAVPVPAELRCVLVRPHMTIETRAARQVLRDHVSLSEHTRQTMRLAGFLAGCFGGDLDRIARSMGDEIVEPQRSGLIPGFDRAREAASRSGALGFGIAGSGPSVFAWARGDSCAQQVREAIVAAFATVPLVTDSWAGPIDPLGARVLAPGSGS